MWQIEAGDQRGALLLSMTFIMAIVALMGAALTTMIFSARESGFQNLQARRAHFIARSGVEYGIKRLVSSDPDKRKNWHENLTVQFANDCQVSGTFTSDSTFKLEVLATPPRAVLKKEVVIGFEDLSQYALLTGGPVGQVSTIPPGLVWHGGEKMPVFRNENLRLSAGRSGYFRNNLKASMGFKFPAGKTVLVNKDLVLEDGIGSTGVIYVSGSASFLNDKNFAANRLASWETMKLSKLPPGTAVVPAFEGQLLRTREFPAICCG